MVDYDKILESGNVLGFKLNKGVEGERRKSVSASSQVSTRGVRTGISIPASICKDLGLTKGDYLNLVTLPNGKVCVCKVRPDIGFKLTRSEQNSNRSKLHYLYIPRIKTTSEHVEAVIEDGLIVFPAGSFE